MTYAQVLELAVALDDEDGTNPKALLADDETYGIGATLTERLVAYLVAQGATEAQALKAVCEYWVF